MVWYAWLWSEYMLYYRSLRQSIIRFGFNQSQTGSIGISFLQSQDVTGLDVAKYQGPVFQRSNLRWTWYLKQSQKPGISKNPRDLVLPAMWNWQLTISVFKPRQAKQYLYRLPPFSFQNYSIISGSQDMILKLENGKWWPTWLKEGVGLGWQFWMIYFMPLVDMMEHHIWIL